MCSQTIGDIMTFTPLAAWILTFLLHSTVLTGLAMLCMRFLGGPAGKALVLRGAMLGAFVTATVAGLAGPGQEWSLPAVENSGAVISVNAKAVPFAGELAPSASPQVTALSSNSAVPPETSVASLGDLAWTWVPVSLILLSLIGVSRLIWRERSAWRMLGRRKRITDPAITRMARGLPVGKDLARRLRLTQSAKTHTPMAIGRREIVLPEKAVAELDPTQLEALLAHEMGHLVRRDPFWLGACRMAVALAWFQPLLRWTLSRLEEETELAADDWAAQRVGNGVNLALCLERVGTWLTEAPTPTSAAAMASSGSVLISRVERLLTDGKPESRRSLVAVSSSVALALGVFSCVGPSVTAGETRQSPARPEGGGDQLMVTKPEPQGDPLFVTGTKTPGEPLTTEGQGIAIHINLSQADRSISYKTMDGAFNTTEALEQWLKSKRNAAKSQSVDLYPASGTQYKDIVPVVDAVVSAGYTDISFDGLKSSIRDEWTERYSEDSKGPDSAKARPYMKLGIRLDAEGSLTSFRVWGKESSGLPQEDPRIAMLNEIHEAESMSIPAVLEVPMNELLIRVEADTPFSHVQKIMEKCASQEVQMPNIHVRINADPDYLTDISLPVDSGIIPEEVEEREAETNRVPAETAAIKLNAPDTASISEFLQADHVKVNFSSSEVSLQFKQVGETKNSVGETSISAPRLTERLRKDILRFPIKTALIDCKPDVPMGDILPLLSAWTARGVKLSFMASMPKVG
ncbi:MAG: M56 family metallopeptidase [Planctomycetota bacterium]|nr:M56 family metallopeptidase [Planctomycetota bacterium]